MCGASGILTSLLSDVSRDCHETHSPIAGLFLNCSQRHRNRRSTAMSQQTIKEGQLYKRGKLNTEWRQRLFILNSKQLTYFKGGKHAPSGIIELKEVRGVSDILQDGTFRIETPVRVFEIRGDTKEEGVGWIESIREARRSCMQELP